MSERRWATVSRRQFLQTAGMLAAGSIIGCSGGSNSAEAAPAVLANPPAVPRNTAFLKWVSTQPTKPSRFELVVMGDNRPNTKTFEKIVRLTDSLKPAFSVHLGDIVQGGTVDQWNKVEPDLDVFTMPVIAVDGNHDRNLLGPRGLDMQLWNTEWGNPQWDFIAGGWHFVGFDTSLGVFTDAHAAWLDTVLNDNLPTMVFTHYPLSVDRWKVHALSAGTDKFLALLRKYSVEQVFMGHNHLFDQMQIGPTLGTITGGAGSALYTQFGFGVCKYHVTHVAVEGAKATVQMVAL